MTQPTAIENNAAVTKNGKRADTRLSLILAAERIFSEEGISNTSLRRITQAAGQRNESAIHYHFGSREGVVQAILDLRTTPINAARIALVEEMRAAAGGAPLGSRDIARLLVIPLANYLRSSAGKSHYLRFLSMLWIDRPIWRKFEGRTQDAGLRMMREALIEAKPHIPAVVMRQRFAMAMQMGSSILARMERLAFDRSETYDWYKTEAQIADLIDSIAAVFDASLSPETVRALRQCGEL
ncbi:TetR/AcrR family transcriptional regulator [Rhizobium sp. L1K21]|uniref:TetR/AcrR family transcriptional regulator n=1 Tax=Rhizobium sp. L1K21 TaxID=2954933 RepID=UPI002092B947|nr:TetR/AcrR family transcriptional regulator [Rhizobium sp. L1K21]MCO6188489.1 TetR family transcriptional regulator [Rhizobium sp. L1K21]